MASSEAAPLHCAFCGRPMDPSEPAGEIDGEPAHRTCEREHGKGRPR